MPKFSRVPKKIFLNDEKNAPFLVNTNYNLYFIVP